MTLSFKVLVGFLLALVILNFFSAIGDGESPLASTELTASLVATENASMSVTDTSNFNSSGYVWIDNEYIKYTSTNATAFQNLTRGSAYGELTTTVTFHAPLALVQNDSASLFETVFGFDISTTTQSWGALSVIVVPVQFMTRTAPRMLLFDYDWLQGNMIYLRMVFLCFSMGFIVTFALIMFRG